MLVRGVVDDELGDDPHAALVRLGDQPLDVLQIAVGGVHRAIVGDVVAVVAQRRRVEGQEPDRGDAEFLDIVEPLQKPLEIADPVAVRIGEGLDVQLIDDRVLVPVDGLQVRTCGDDIGGRDGNEFVHLMSGFQSLGQRVILKTA